eukprot:CCRYP_019143-RA/>CCRYP_019143-RA protein AED:0.00 eAED:0.00 QI:25/1/1/1/0/0/2/135/46
MAFCLSLPCCQQRSAEACKYLRIVFQLGAELFACVSFWWAMCWAGL